MKPSPIESVILLLGAALPAQQVYVSATAVSPMVVEVAQGGNVVNESQASGPLPLFGLLQAQTANFEASARTSWSHWATTQEAFFDMDLLTVVSPFPGVSATSGEHEVLLRFSASTLLAADLELSATVTSTAGAPTPFLRVDVYDDGISELSESNPHGSVPLILGTAAVSVRVRARIEAMSGELAHLMLRVRLAPRNDLQLGTFVQGCENSSFLFGTPSFVGSGVDFRMVTSAPQDPHLLVLSLAAEPVALPAMHGLPCILLPRPDVVILLGYSGQTEHLSIPPAVRPLMLFAQGVHLQANGIGLTNGLVVSAY